MSKEKDFDQLVNLVNEKFDNFSQNKKETIIQKFQKRIKKAFLWLRMNDPEKITELLFENLYWIRIKWLTPNQMDSILLASDKKRAFNKTKKELEKEKTWKDPEVIKQIDKEILKAKELFETLYNQHKESFYKK